LKLTSEDTTLPTDLGLPITTSLVLSTQLSQLVFQAERQGLLKVVVWSLSFFGIGESSNGDTLEDGLAVGSLSEDESSGTVTDRRDGLLGVVELQVSIYDNTLIDDIPPRRAWRTLGQLPNPSWVRATY
jgi:hypothetical protein